MSEHITHVSTRKLTVTPFHAIIAAYRPMDPKRQSPAEYISRISLARNTEKRKMVQIDSLESQSGLVQMSQCLDITRSIVAHLVHGNVLRTTTDGAAACRTAGVERLWVAGLVNQRADTGNSSSTADWRKSGRRQFGRLCGSTCSSISQRSRTRERRRRRLP
jgi:hypothetical protein